MTELSPADGSLFEESNLTARTIQYPATPTRSMSAAYVLELRRLIREDAYRSEEVADVIARRIFASGDL
ncbi:MAG: hypothetical protein ABIT20_18985 [Gemmatimonadaceae bacterium]